MVFKKKKKVIDEEPEFEEEPEEEPEEDPAEEEDEIKEKELPKMPTPAAQPKQPKPMTQQEISVVAEDYLLRSIELLRYMRGIR